MSNQLPGLEGYTPTRLEWLANMLNTLFRYEFLKDQGANLFYMAAEDGESITIVVRPGNSISKENMDETIDHAKKMVKAVAGLYGWDEWVEVKVQLFPEE